DVVSFKGILTGVCEELTAVNYCPLGEQALLEPAWNPVKSINKEELLIWRIEGSEVKQVEDSEYGIFFDDAIYILLKAANKQRKICYDLHFWIPHSMVKYIAAEPPAKVMELSALLHDRVIYHKEIEYFESSIVKHYFKTFIVLHDGVDTAFNENDPRAYKPRLLLFKLNRSRGELRQVPASKKALNSHCVFVLDTGREMLQWNGSSCSDEERSAVGGTSQSPSLHKLSSLSCTARSTRPIDKTRAMCAVLREGANFFHDRFLSCFHINT
uniref:Gelsolin-like domain-containing protein n=1 Tax=Mesocestoides corti TaxID=53468 RepID=A0A5K3F193_MESCO